ncbi:acyl-[acyl-carrier-protein]--UDP-N-acetylglucosam ine O-acyltransferase [Desulfosarcina ovata subsp. sediminis]|uniref:Acyl-[acyl-carrier-protein]--UDP-N-acetylglucosamine O-acyltransferase n=1 Tax=Desulfosarcina ovata subsp. sediminis TaxID=885957 RepID=A0A5K7ZMK6_9BACT|nr:acyl-ACP--UDP-N-acetylglucosamine O-acyltransferase [Desulfosarcina ovata]BBO81387.1 acyl-[acyl-carrier-protein]--UDP-N-acetylglucosam ine O-acyltransferase [Desulfosarcina ovata subsp. sediminis]
MIHPTSIVSPDAIIGEDVEIGAYSIIGPHVTIGKGTWIGPHVVIDPFVTIGPGCKIFQFAAIGAIPQDLKFGGEKSWVKIGANVTIREFVTIHRGTEPGGSVTELGERCFLMAYTHIAHDCHVGKMVVLANNTTLAGHITIGNYATVGGLVAIHQFVRVGDYAFVGGKSAVVKDVPPYVIAAGDRAVLHGLNRVGLKRHGFSDQTLSALKKTYRILFRYGLTLNEAISRIHAEVEMVPEVKNFIGFIKASARGVTR